MADNVAITAGAGTSVATDDVGGTHFQKIKVDAGGDGVSVPVVAGQQAMAASVPVVVASDQTAVPVSDGGGALTVDGTVAVTNAGITTIAGAVAGTEMQVDVVAALPAGESVIGLVGASDTVITVTPTVEAAAYASGDLIFDSSEIANAVRANGYCAILESITLLDKGDQGVALTLVFANAATDFGTLNSAPDPDDTEAATVIGCVPIATSDYLDLGASKVACIKNIGLLLKAGGATTSLYVAGINGTGAPTYASTSDLVIQFGFLRS